MLSNLDPTNKKKLMDALKEISTSLTRVEAERDLQKNIRKDICEALDLKPKVFNKLAKTYHKQNFGEEVQLHEEFETLYTTVTK